MRTKLVCEIGINGLGDINMTKKLIDEAVMGGAYAVKFQKRNVDLVYSKEELSKYRESPFGKTNGDLKRQLEYSEKEYDEIAGYCKEKEIEWWISPWDVDSVDFLCQYDIPYIKIASAMNTNIELLNKIRDTDKDVIVSTGMTDEAELETLIDIFGDRIKYILSCTSTYPTKAEDMNMKRIETLKEFYPDFKIGFSNHSSGILYIIQAAIMGCEMIEYHITLDRTMYGSDQSASIERPGMLKIKDYIEGIEAGWGDGKIECLENEKPIKEKLRK